MTQTGGFGSKAGGALALLLAASPLSAPAAAQSVNDYRLPGATTTQAPANTQGPVDPDNPVVRQPVVRPTATPSPAPTETQPAAAPKPAAPRTATPTVSPRAAAPLAATAPSPQVSAQPTPDADAPLPTGQPSAAPLALPTLAPAPNADESNAGPAAYWPWIAGALALLALVFAALWWRSRTAREPQVAFESPVVTEADPSPAPAPAPIPAAPSPMPAPQLAAAGLPARLAMILEARRMTASLMATTLNYSLRITNDGAEELATLAVEGDMISAHASLPTEQQIAGDALRLELRHAAVSLAPGESIEFTGDLRLPLSAVTPIRSGEAAYFVPLARLRVEGSTAAGDVLLMVQTFVVGELPENPGGGLRPFRLDLGPRTYSRIGQRPVG